MGRRLDDEKVEVVDGITYRFSTTWIRRIESEQHWLHYRQQALMVSEFVSPGMKVLEIGVGSGFLANYLRAKGYSVLTLDIDHQKKPDISCNIASWQPTQAYGAVLGFNVFEHVPFDVFLGLLGKLSVTGTHTLLMSVPIAEKTVARLNIKIPKLPALRVELNMACRKIVEGHHHWEIGKTPGSFITIQKFRQHAKEVGFSVLKQRKYNGKLYAVLALSTRCPNGRRYRLHIPARHTTQIEASHGCAKEDIRSCETCFASAIAPGGL